MKIIIYGNGDFGRLMYHYFDTDSEYKVVAFCADNKYIVENTFCKLPLIAFEDIETLYPAEEYKIFIAIGYSNMRARAEKYNNVRKKQYSCVNYIHSTAIVDQSLLLGENNAIFANVTIEPFVTIGDNNIIWSSATICHNVKIKNHSFLASQTLIGGFTIVNNNCFLGFNSTVLHNIEIAQETLIGAKALITKDTKKYSKYIGIPAKYVSSHEAEGIRIS